ncbi:MAG: glycosyltransferase family 2 protein, partial [Pseudonocardia sp.]|nr:glycosyltransferase family 2 protein [Pseudonocardia sp.]
ADNGSTDDTRARVGAWRDRLPSLRVVDASAVRGVAHARNVGLAAARGDLLFICDGDDIVAPDWLEHMAAALDDHPIVTGFIDIVTLNDPEQYGWTGDATRETVPVAYEHLPYAPGGNIGMWREVFTTVGPFEEQIRRAEDIDFGWRAAALGISVHFVPDAVLHRRMRATPWSAFRSAIAGGKAEVWLHRAHRDDGMAAASWDDVREQYRWLARRAPAVVRGEADPHQWAHHLGKRLGRAVGSARYRTRFL